MLPPGYVVNRDKSAAADQESDDDEDKLTMEEQIEEDRKLITGDLTPVTLESFNAWKERKAKKKADELEAKINAEMAKGKKDKGQMNFMSGKALFTYNPDLFEDDAAATADIVFEEDEQNNNAATGASASAAAASNKTEEVKVDKDLFADDAGADEDVDFD